MEKLSEIPKEEMARRQEEALAINRLIDELKNQDENLSAQEAAEKIIAG